MSKATLTLKSGAIVTIEGSPSEVHELLQLHEDKSVSIGARKSEGSKKDEPEQTSLARDSVSEIVNLIRSCDDAERIESQILDKSSAVNRCLLPLYIVHEQLNDAFGLTTGQIASITKELKVPIFQSNVANTLAGHAGKFVMADSTRKPGVPVEYRINRRGVQHLEAVIKTK